MDLREKLQKASQVSGGGYVNVDFDGNLLDDQIEPSDLEFAVSAWMGRLVSMAEDAKGLVWKLSKDVEIGDLLIELSEMDPGDVYAVNLVGVSAGADNGNVVSEPYWLIGVRCRPMVLDSAIDIIGVAYNGEVYDGLLPGDMWNWEPPEQEVELPSFVTLRLLGDASRGWAEQQLRMVDRSADEGEG